MIVLGIDTATPATAVALALPDATILQLRDEPTGGERPGHATRLLPLASQLLAEAGLDWSEIERIGVGVGPGTFTGLRIGVASARGLAQSLEVPLLGVSSLRALDYAASDEDVDAVLAVIDARRGEIFAAAYDQRIEILEPQACAPSSLRELLARSEERTDRKREWTAVGDGAVRYREALEGPSRRVAEDNSPLHLIDARAICRLAAQAPPEKEPVLPPYLRRPDAEIALMGAGSA
jgi:tRNA threonylcarbamoyladenosine biosynthesis protein TsaB